MEDLLVTGIVYLELHVPPLEEGPLPAPGREVFVPELPVRLGGAINVASVLRALGAPVRLATPVSSGHAGHLLRATALQLELPLIEWAASREGSVSIVFHQSRDRSFLSAADFEALETVAELPAAAFIHVPGLREAHALRAALSLARMRGARISLNLSWYPDGFATLMGEPPLCCDLLVMNELEARELAGSPEEVLRTLGARVDTVVVTLGSGGAVASFAGRRLQVEASPVKVIDYTGAGDAFCAGLLAARHKGHRAETQMSWGTQAAARVLGIYGGVLDGHLSLESEVTT